MIVYEYFKISGYRCRKLTLSTFCNEFEFLPFTTSTVRRYSVESLLITSVGVYSPGRLHFFVVAIEEWNCSIQQPVVCCGAATLSWKKVLVPFFRESLSFFQVWLIHLSNEYSPNEAKWSLPFFPGIIW